MALEDFEHRARDEVTLFDWLVRVRGRRHKDRSRLSESRQLAFEQAGRILFYIYVGSPGSLFRLHVRHVRNVAVGAAYSATHVRVQREPAHARTIQDRLWLYDVELDRVLRLAFMSHTLIIDSRLTGRQSLFIRTGEKSSRFYVGGRQTQREDAVEAVAVGDYELQVVVCRLHKVAFAARLGFIQQQLRVVDDAVSFHEYSTQGFV